MLSLLQGSYPEGEFDQLVSLDLCVMCSLDWLNLILSRSPKLRALKLYQSVSFDPNLDDVVASSVYIVLVVLQLFFMNCFISERLELQEFQKCPHQLGETELYS